MDIKFIKNDNGVKDFDKVEKGDVVVLPAFGATIQEMQLLDKKYICYKINFIISIFLIIDFI